MTLGIMQPYFAPYVGYFDLIRQCDRWIVFDSVQYIRHGWVNRNRILHPTTGWQYVIVPLKKHHQETAICNIQPADDQKWREKILGQLQHYRRVAPHYETVVALIQEVFAAEFRSIVDLNVAMLQAACIRLKIPFRYEIFSKMNLSLPTVNTPGAWALEIATALRADAYLNPPGGKDLFDAASFKARGINLRIQEIPKIQYATPGYAPVEHLSIIDVMMWNDPDQILAQLDQSRSPA